MTKASDNAFPSLLITEGTEPSAPAAGKQRLYIDSTTHLLKATNSSGTDRTLEGAASGAITSSGLTMATARLLGRTTASSGAVEEITVGSGLTLSAGSLAATGSGTVDWSQAINVSGTSAAGWTAQNGTWSSTGSVIQNTDAGAANKWFRFDTKQLLGVPVIFEAECKVVSGGGLAGIILGYNGATNTGGLFVGIADTANKVSIEAPAGITEVNSYSNTITTGTFYKIRVIRSGFASVYLDGTLQGNTEPATLSGAVAPWDYVALRCHTAAAEFRNIKLWTLSTGIPA